MFLNLEYCMATWAWDPYKSQYLLAWTRRCFFAFFFFIRVRTIFLTCELFFSFQLCSSLVFHFSSSFSGCFHFKIYYSHACFCFNSEWTPAAQNVFTKVFVDANLFFIQMWTKTQTSYVAKYTHTHVSYTPTHAQQILLPQRSTQLSVLPTPNYNFTQVCVCL